MALSHLIGGRGNNILDPWAIGTVWDPLEGFSMLDNAPSRQFARDAHAVANTQIDWRETPEAHIFKADLPGLKKEEVKVQVVEGKTLEISGQRKKEEVQKGDTWHRVERAHGSFLRRFRLPENTNADEVTAQVQDGVLTVTIPKVQKPKPQIRQIEIAPCTFSRWCTCSELSETITDMALSHLIGGRGNNILDPWAIGTVWDPLEGFSMLDNAPSRQFARDAHAVANTQIDWRETPEAHIFKADLPGLKKEEVKVQVVEGKTLEISGQRKKEEVQKGDTWHRVERAHGSFLRRFRLPENTNADEVTAQVQDGVLTVTIPKVQKPKPQIRQIEIA